MNDLHTNQGKAATRRVKPRKAPRAANVFHTPIAAPTFHHAQRQAARRTVKAAQKIPAVRTNNRNITRLVKRENPQYRKDAKRTLAKVKSTRAVPPSARHKANPRLHFLALRVLEHGPETGMKVFGNRPFAGYADAEGVHVTPYAVHQAFGKGKGRAFAREIPIHEYAHTLQHPHFAAHGRPSRAVSEGGAEAFKLLAARDIGMPPVAAPAYAKWARRVLIGKGIRYVTRGQFK